MRTSALQRQVNVTALRQLRLQGKRSRIERITQASQLAFQLMNPLLELHNQLACTRLPLGQRGRLCAHRLDL